MTCRRHPRVFFISLLLITTFGGAPAVAAPAVELSDTGVGPRQMEPTLEQSIPRDYAKAWQSLSAALEGCDPASLEQYWVGIAHDKFQRMVEDQARTGIQVRYRDISHHLQPLFYPTDGAALLLNDNAQIEITVLKSGNVIHRETRSERYLVLMTPAQDRWLVRVLQSSPLS